MRWRCRVIPLLLCVALLCGGCMGSREIDTMSFILTIGVDQSDEPGQYIFTFRVAMPRAFTGDGGGENKDRTKLVSVKAPAIGTAVRQLAVAMNRQVEMSHVSALFVQEAVARDGIRELVSLFLRSRVYRNTMLLLVTKEEVKTVMEKNTSPFELFQYRWVDSVKRTQAFAGDYVINDVRAFYLHLADPQRAILTGYGTVIEKSLDKTAAAPLPQQLVPQYTAETFPREGGTELIVVGSAIFYDWKMIGTLNASESMGANILTKGLRTMFTIPDPLQKGELVTLGAEVKRPRVAVALNKGRLLIDVQTEVIAELSDASSNVDYARGENRRILQKQISDSIRASLTAYFKATQPLGADCVQLTNRFRRETATWQEWAALDWPSLYRDAEFQVTVETSMHRSGLLWRYRGGEEP